MLLPLALGCSAAEKTPYSFYQQKLGLNGKSFLYMKRNCYQLFSAGQKWEQYLMGRPFIIKTDHKRLKQLLEQKITTPFQHFWLSKLMDFDYIIQYKSGVENIVADTLSRVFSASLFLLAISHMQSDLLQLIEQSWTNDPRLQHIIEQKQQNVDLFPKY